MLVRCVRLVPYGTVMVPTMVARHHSYSIKLRVCKACKGCTGACAGGVATAFPFHDILVKTNISRVVYACLAAAALAWVCPVTAAAAAADATCGALQNHTNFDGNDVGVGVVASSAGECCSLCVANQAATGECLFFTFNPATKCTPTDPLGCCHLKNSEAGRKASGTAVSAALLQPPTPPAPAGAKNILLVMADDLRPNLGFLHPFMITPAMDRLVARGMLFARAYVQQQVRPSCHRFF